LQTVNESAKMMMYLRFMIDINFKLKCGFGIE
jgi:hypothetical protein